jgi:hypothetical protein
LSSVEQTAAAAAVAADAALEAELADREGGWSTAAQLQLSWRPFSAKKRPTPSADALPEVRPVEGRRPSTSRVAKGG